MAALGIVGASSTLLSTCTRFALLGILVGDFRERNVLCHDLLDLLFHLLHLCMSEGLNAEVVILLKLVLDNIVAFIEGGDNILVENLVAGQLQKVKSACLVLKKVDSKRVKE